MLTPEKPRLTPEIVQALRAPFPAEAIKWKLQTNPREGSEWATMVAYVDARDVAERLDLATGGDWSDDYQPPAVTAGDQVSLLCVLTVCGVTRRDVGTVPRPSKGGDATKDLHSDALKRAAVQFGVAAHVYRFPAVQARAKAKTRGDRTTYFIPEEVARQLEQLTQQLLAGATITDRAFPDLRVWGSTFGADGTPLQPHQEGAEEPAVARPARPARQSQPRMHGTNGTNGTAHTATGTGGGKTSTTAPSPADLARAHQALREAEQKASVAVAARKADGATVKQRECIQRLIADLSADEATVQGLAEMFSASLHINGAALLSDPQVALKAPLTEQAAGEIIRELQALR
ncbi:MAG: hypothetical protein OHK0022_21860 [Roseiflexaceae bacterium]